MAKNNLTRLLLGYEMGDDRRRRFKTIVLTGNVTRERSKFVRHSLRIADVLLKALSYTSTRTYGTLLLSFGLLSFLLHYLQSYINATRAPLYAIISSVAITLVGILLMFFDKPLSIAMQDFPLTDYVFFEFFCIKRMHRIDLKRAAIAEKDSERVRVVRPFVALFLGLLLASLSMIVPLWWILVGVGVLVYLCLTLISPEFSFFAIFFAMPYISLLEHGNIVLGCAVLATVISFAIKVALGKRVYHLEQYDLLLGMFLVFVLVSGIFVKGIESFGASVVMLVFAMGYVLSSSLISNRRLADCLVNSVIISAVPVSVYASVTGIIRILRDGYAGFTGVSATFVSPSSLAVYLLVSGVFALYLARARRKRAAKVLYAILFVLILTALFFTAQTWAFIAGILGLVTYCALGLRKGGPLISGLISVLPYSMLFLGDGILTSLDRIPVLRDIGFGELAHRWDASFAMLRDNLLVGIGIGSDSFAKELQYYSDRSYTDSGSFLLEIGCEAGIFALAAFIILLLVRLCHMMAYRKYTVGSEVHKLSVFSAVAMTILLVFGAVNYLWSDFSLTYIYWCVFGIGSAALRVSRREYDDRAAYFSDGRSSDASSIDVELC